MLITPRWKKVISDLWGNKVRTLLVVMSIAVGIFAVGVVSGTYQILQKDVNADYLSANPHRAVIYCQLFDDDLLAALRRTPGVAQVEGSTSITAQIADRTGKLLPAQISGIPALSELQIDQLRLESGAADLGDREIYLERSSYKGMGVNIGDMVKITLADGRVRDLQIAGVVHDVTGDPFMFSNSVSGFVNLSTIEWLGGSRLYNSVLLTTAERGSDEAHVREVASWVATKITKSGREVFITIVFHPGQHPIQQILDPLLALLGALGLMAVFLSVFLVVNTISAMMSQQIRQIGVMKAVGADMGQIVGMYLTLVLAFGIVALLLAVPLSAVAAYLFSSFIAQLMNVNLAAFRIPSQALTQQVLVGLCVPLIGALWPVLGGARLTVREAISNYGLSAGSRRGWFDQVLETVRGLPRPLLISLRNTFRRKGRLLLTLSTLTLGGAIFISVFNVRNSMYLALDKTFGYILSDVNVDFQRSYRMKRIEEAFVGVPGFVSAEGWGLSNAQAIRPDGETGDDIVIFAPPAGSSMIKPVMTSGRWLISGDENAIIIGNHFVKMRPEVKLGDEVNLRIEGHDFPFRIVGTYEMAGTVIPPIVYANFEYLARIRNEVGQVYSLRVVTEQHDFLHQQEAVDALKARFDQLGLAVAGIRTGTETINQQRAAVDIMIYLLLSMAVLIAVVGGLGLMGTMSMNVLERTREIGVMRSIGAVDLAIMQLVVVEGMFIGLISWALALLVTIPITYLLDTVVGISILNVPLAFVFSKEGTLIWVVVVLFLSMLASVVPAQNAVRLTVRDVLAYE